MAHEEKFQEILAQSVPELEIKLNLTSGFLDSLREEDDWSFVIKAHALIEAMVGYTAVKAIQKPSLEDWITSLPLNGSSSKTTILAKLDELTKGERRYVQSLSTIRNKLVHNIEEVNIVLENYFSCLSENARKDAIDGLTLSTLMSKTDNAIYDKFLLNPKLFIWKGLRIVLTLLNERSSRIEAENRSRELKIDIFNKHSEAKDDA